MKKRQENARKDRNRSKGKIEEKCVREDGKWRRYKKREE
jgi:hypothetical protein